MGGDDEWGRLRRPEAIRPSNLLMDYDACAVLGPYALQQSSLLHPRRRISYVFGGVCVSIPQQFVAWNTNAVHA